AHGLRRPAFRSARESPRTRPSAAPLNLCGRRRVKGPGRGRRPTPTPLCRAALPASASRCRLRACRRPAERRRGRRSPWPDRCHWRTRRRSRVPGRAGQARRPRKTPTVGRRNHAAWVYTNASEGADIHPDDRAKGGKPMRALIRGALVGLVLSAVALSACQRQTPTSEEGPSTPTNAEREAEIAAETLAALGGPASAEQRAAYEGEFQASGGIDALGNAEGAWELTLLNDYAQFTRPGLGEDGGIPGE